MYVPSTRNIISSYYAVFGEKKSSALAYTSQPYAESMDINLSVSYIPCATYSREQIGDKIAFAQFEKGHLLFENRDDA